MDQPAASARLDRETLLRWLCSDAVVASDGRVWSWHNPEHPGYAYPEAGGLWLSLMARETRADEAQLERVARWLARCEAEEGIGREGRRYVFDHGMVLAGQLAWHARRGLPHTLLEPSMSTLTSELRARRALRREPSGDRWSERFGPHLLKLALPLAKWAAYEPELRASNDALARLLSQISPRLHEDGRIPSGSRSNSPTYLHAHCYAAEGLWRLSESPLPVALRSDAREFAERATIWLAQVQRPDGGLPPWHDGTRAWGPAPADVAAQAVRLWSGLDRDRFAESVDRALTFLARLGTPAGGLRYHEDSRDLNTWATLFTVQALDFARAHADVRVLV